MPQTLHGKTSLHKINMMKIRVGCKFYVLCTFDNKGKGADEFSISRSLMLVMYVLLHIDLIIKCQVFMFFGIHIYRKHYVGKTK